MFKFWVESFYDKKQIVQRIRKAGFRLSKKPDFIITYGGDGTILFTEYKHPGVPKIPIKKSIICSKCKHYVHHDLGGILNRIRKGNYRISEEQKVEAIFRNKKIKALNEIQIHNSDPRKALRLELTQGKEKIIVIGDGIIISTAYGSTAYYKTAGNKPFKKGIRIGFNNPLIRLQPLILRKNITVKVLRERGFLTADNNELIKIAPGDIIKIYPSKEKAKFVVI